MNKSFWLFLLVLPILVLLQSCNFNQAEVAVQNQTVTFLGERDITKSGKLKEATKLANTFTEDTLSLDRLPPLTDDVAKALEQIDANLNKASRRGRSKYGNLYISTSKLKATAQSLLQHLCEAPELVTQQLVAHQISGQDGKGHVKMTGYYTPVIDISLKQSAKFHYPIYSRPRSWEGAYPSREAIDKGALKDKGLEIAYAKDPMDVYLMQLQGSGYAKINETGKTVLLAYDGTNKHPYRSIGKKMSKDENISIKNISAQGMQSFLKKNPAIKDTILHHNASYTFFTMKHEEVYGAAGIPLIEEVSIAVDPKYIPLGSVILAEVPTYNPKGQLIGHTLKYLVATDKGGKIRGKGHIDLYTGKGIHAQQEAGHHYHYGRMWLLLPKDQLVSNPTAFHTL